nr:hypothetical protein [Rhizobium sp. ACO-34A]
MLKAAVLATVLALSGGLANAQERDPAQEEANHQLVVSFYYRFSTVMT